MLEQVSLDAQLSRFWGYSPEIFSLLHKQTVKKYNMVNSLDCTSQYACRPECSHVSGIGRMK